MLIVHNLLIQIKNLIFSSEGSHSSRESYENLSDKNILELIINSFSDNQLIFGIPTWFDICKFKKNLYFKIL